MSQYDNTEQVNQGLDAAKSSVEAGKRTIDSGRKTRRKISKLKNIKSPALGGKGLISLINPKKLKITLFVLSLIFVIVIICIVGNTISSSFRDTYREDSIGSSSDTLEKQIKPQTQKEKTESLYDDNAPKQDTRELADILHEVKQKDFDQVQQTLSMRVQNAVMRDNKGEDNIDYEASVRSIKTELAENSHWIYSGTGANTVDTTINVLMVDDDKANQRVADRLEKAGCKVTTVFDEKSIDASKYDALVIPGGGNVTPSLYGAKKTKNTTNNNIKKDKLQIKAVKAFADKKKPILGLCRGCQLINVAFGGTIDQGNGTYHKGWDTVTFEKDSLCYKVYGKKLNCCHYHKQQIKDVAPGFKVTTWGKKGKKKIIEGIEHESLPIYCTQWHPDFVKMGKDGQKIFDAFVDVIKKQKGVTGSAASTNSKYKSSNPAIQGAIDWAVMIANDNSFNYGHHGPANACGCYFCGTNDRKVKKTGDERYKKTYMCMGFVTAAYAHGANDPEVRRCCENRGCLKTSDENFKDYTCWKLVGRMKDLKLSDLEPGDVLVHYDGNCSHGHMSLYLGDNDIADANGDGFGADTIAIRENRASRYLKMNLGSPKKKNYVMRYVGTGNGNGRYDLNAVKSLTSYDSLTVIKTISQNTGTIKNVSAGDGYVFQSFAYYKNYYYLQSATADAVGTDGRVHKLDNSCTELDVSDVLESGHGNGITYCTKDSTLYSVTTAAVRNNRKSLKVDPESLKSKGTASLKHGTSSIAYDRITDRFITSSGAASGKASDAGYLYIYDSDLKTAAAINKIKKLRWATPGDICAYNGVIYVTISKGTSTANNNYIDMYREEDGAYLGSYSCPYYEIEGIDIDDNGKIILLFHGPGSDFLQFTELTALGGVATSGGGTGISVLDMDIIAAYNISIANSSMYVDESKLSKGNKKGILESRGYRDVSGKKVKVYWFGKNKGLINYKKDFKKKIDSLIKGDPQARSTAGTILIDKPDGTKWYHLLVNSNNKIPDDYSPELVTIDAKYISSGDTSDKWRNRVDSRIYDYLKAMMDDCTAAMKKEYGNNSHKPLICSAYRTYDMQKELYDSTANKSDTAIPGTSEHECGLAVDIVDKSYQSLDDSQADQAAQKWLMANCQKYGFILRYPKGKQGITGIIWEPWHYRYVGKSSAKTIMKYGCTLEEFLTGSIQTGEAASSGYIGGDGGYEEDSKHFYKIVIADKPETTTSADGDKVKYYPATLKEKEVDELLGPIFGLDAEGQYLNSKTGKLAKLDAAKEAQKVQEDYESNTSKNKKKSTDYEDVKGITENQDSFQLATMGKEGSATNLVATQTLSDETGQILFGDPIYVSNLGNEASTGGKLAEPLGSYPYTWTSPFGKRWGRLHSGVDMAAPKGTPIYAAHDGTVTRAAYYGGYGNCCDITKGNMTTRYGHMCTAPVVNEGDPIQPGQLIGYVGNTGNSFGAHLHFEVIINGTAVNPVDYLGSLATAPKSADFND